MAEKRYIVEYIMRLAAAAPNVLPTLKDTYISGTPEGAGH